jgi:poly(A) polymerase
LFGSYRLGVHFPSTDIDAICAFKAGIVTRQMFFDQFVQMIEKDPRFSLVCSVNQAQVPIIKCVIDGVQFDLLYASVEKPNELIAKLHESNPSQ